MTQLFTYLLMDSLCHSHPFLCLHFVQWSKCGILSLGPNGTWCGNSNSVEIFVQCTYSPSFIILYSFIQKLSRWQTNKQTSGSCWKHPPCSIMLCRWKDISRNHTTWANLWETSSIFLILTNYTLILIHKTMSVSETQRMIIVTKPGKYACFL